MPTVPLYFRVANGELQQATIVGSVAEGGRTWIDEMFHMTTSVYHTQQVTLLPIGEFTSKGMTVTFNNEGMYVQFEGTRIQVTLIDPASGHYCVCVRKLFGINITPIPRVYQLAMINYYTHRNDQSYEWYRDHAGIIPWVLYESPPDEAPPGSDVPAPECSAGAPIQQPVSEVEESEESFNDSPSLRDEQDDDDDSDVPSLIPISDSDV
jgi:hypothetical protein